MFTNSCPWLLQERTRLLTENGEMFVIVNASDQWKDAPDFMHVGATTLLIFTLVVFSTLCQAVNVFGIVTNSINIVCFVKQGFKESINVSLLGINYLNVSCNRYVLA